MTDRVRAEELRRAERRLQAAQLASDVACLDALLDDRLVFTGPDGGRHSKEDDLRVHRSGRQVLTTVAEEELTVLVTGPTGVTWFLGRVVGSVDGSPFDVRMRYTRTWVRDDRHGWRVIAAHASVV
ncbi:protein of unknown function [Micromonospora citrea]|uniref:DUF4440 domain-containing protein n=1 Tax=Micromonospora citrea TaxID=47855 RepID=A0A1C6TV24_9ACTN|nr:nuclear transport factor 2 family protein [Micromonospora citrea]SCL45656.1 protein of unknown function [Micromonospora citrea]